MGRKEQYNKHTCYTSPTQVIYYTVEKYANRSI